MRAITRAITGDAGLGPAFAFLAAGAVAVAFAFSAGLFLASRSEAASSASVGLLLLTPLAAGAVHSLVCAAAIHRASRPSPASTRALSLTIAGVYCVLQFAAIIGGALVAFAFGV